MVINVINEEQFAEGFIKSGGGVFYFLDVVKS